LPVYLLKKLAMRKKSFPEILKSLLILRNKGISKIKNTAAALSPFSNPFLILSTTLSIACVTLLFFSDRHTDPYQTLASLKPKSAFEMI